MYLPLSLPVLLLSQATSCLNPFSTSSSLDIPRPDPPARDGYESLPDGHSRALADAWDKLETTFAIPEEEWTSEGQEAGVQRWSRTNAESGLPLMKGEGFIEGFSPLEVSAVLESMTMRKFWDPRMDTGFMLSRFSPSTLSFYTATKPPGFLVWARDIVGASDNKHTDNSTRIKSLATSVVDERAPPQSDKVRAELHFSGWDLEATDAGTHVVALTSIDLAGSLPNWVTRSALKETPLAIARVRDALTNIGVPPRLIGSPDSVVQLSHLADDRRSWVLYMRGAKGDSFGVRWSRKMFPGGVDVSVEGDGKDGIKYEHDGETVKVEVGDDAHERQVMLRLAAK